MSLKRRQSREKEKADQYLNLLIKRFIAFKNKHFVEENGVLVIDVEAEALRNQLKFDWNRFCDLKQPVGELKYNKKAFHQATEVHLHKHKQLCYVNHVMRLMIVNYNTGTKEYEQLMVAFENGTPAELAAEDFSIQIYEEELV
ncbi:MAG: hypothetical protein NTZ33_14510 [Bacteroidetes bacterium]|nr:hypothetical protein [Bacteroidota bacterium]